MVIALGSFMGICANALGSELLGSSQEVRRVHHDSSGPGLNSSNAGLGSARKGRTSLTRITEVREVAFPGENPEFLEENAPCNLIGRGMHSATCVSTSIVARPEASVVEAMQRFKKAMQSRRSCSRCFLGVEKRNLSVGF